MPKIIVEIDSDESISVDSIAATLNCRARELRYQAWVGRTWTPDFGELDETGFIFLDEEREAFLCRMWDGIPWLFYWHPEKCWAPERVVSQSEVETFPRNLTLEQHHYYRGTLNEWNNKVCSGVLSDC